MERRLKTQAKSSDLPHDYLAMVREVFTANFDAGLKALAKLKASPSFDVRGKVFPDELVLAVTLLHEEQLAATTVYASQDFDPKASAPTLQDLLSAAVDAIAAIYGELLNVEKPEILEQLADESLSALENIPFEWTQVKIDKFKVHTKVDKSNPNLDELADQWLKKNDPTALEELEAEEKATEALFVTGPKKKT